jgi:CRISPR-associated protein Cmr2
VTLLELWQYKVLQTLHDPIHKIAVQGRMGHVEAGRRLVEALTGKRRKPFTAPDRLATGADRPVVGSKKTCFVHWPTSPILTHPLQRGLRLEVDWDLVAAPDGAKMAAARELHERVHDMHLPFALPAGGWESEASVRRLLLQLWRLAPEMLRDAGLQAAYLPADSRCPDHSVWDHTRIAAAAAYLEEIKTKRRTPEREPWMLAFTLGGVQRFLRESRKTRDLWTASMIYADLAWAAMRPVVEALGPDAILYPDLRGNPSADRWLLDTAPDAVPKAVHASDATSYAAMLPNTFAALMPRGGGDSGLPDLVELARQGERAVRDRWRELAGAVERWLERRAGSGSWLEIWKRQVDGGLGEPPVAWVAIPWPRRMYGLGNPTRGPVVPGQSAQASTIDRPEQLETREGALSPWLPPRVWRHYELARDVFWHTHAGYLTDERGFDYPLVHHQLRAALAMRKAAAVPRVQEEPGEKCCLTGREEVLYDAEGGPGPRVARRRQGARKFWTRFDAERRGAERLGSTGAVKRFLVQAAEPAFTATWESGDERRQRGDDEPRVPFPSTAAIVAAPFLEALAEASHPPVVAAIRDYVAACAAGGLDETVDPRCLPALARAARGPAMPALLRIEPEYLFPEALEILARSAPDAQKEARQAFREASVKLRKAAADAGVPAPRKLVAVLRMDGDALGLLILGDPQAIPTTWRDVLHPKAVEEVLAKLPSDGWPGLLDERRHMGPALHAAVSRSLADFAHKMVAWVVEREFGGRLVYAGGDDLLALLPAVEVVPAAARLQQLFSAPYVVDTDADADPWSWRRGEIPGGPEEARQRFRVPVARGGTIRLSEAAFEDHAAGDPTPSELPGGRGVALYPMLGRGQSLSAGIAIAHYKTPLSLLLETAEDLLESEAKERMGRSALAVALLSRGGTKAIFASRWRVRETGDSGSEGRSEVEPEPPDVQLHLDRVIEAFGRRRESAERSAGGRLPGRLPYKLRQSIELTGRVMVESEKDAGPMIRRLVALESGLSEEALIESISQLVECGLRYGKGQDRRLAAGRLSQTAVAGLLLARRLAKDGGGDGPA